LKIIVTGGAGFIGSNLVDALVERGDEVVVIDNLSTGRRENLNPHIKFYETSIGDPGLADIFEKEKPDIVCHHAAQIDLRRSVNEPLFDAEVNILGSLNVIVNSIRSLIQFALEWENSSMHPLVEQSMASLNICPLMKNTR